ncbi:hypothetical protein KBT16_03815 [Nostoc sp. CCCryo 231-06]|nr:hypothetical protein [Nostoc sp. CCCryo 231-06]
MPEQYCSGIKGIFRDLPIQMAICMPQVPANRVKVSLMLTTECGFVHILK